jgi:hypothetical protein
MGKATLLGTGERLLCLVVLALVFLSILSTLFFPEIAYFTILKI